MTAVSVPGRAVSEMLSSSVLLPSMVHVTPCTSRPPVLVAGCGLGAADQRAAAEHQVDVADGDRVALVQDRGLDARHR